jgi:hypothetical protein
MQRKATSAATYDRAMGAKRMGVAKVMGENEDEDR